MLHRPLALVSVLLVGDYLLWDWSLGGSHDTVALISGLTLPPLAIGLIGLLALNLARLLAHSARRPRARLTARGGAHLPHRRGGPSDSISESWEDEQVSRSASSKLAA